MIPDSAMVMRCCELLRGHIRHNMLTGWSYDEIGYTPEMKAMGLSSKLNKKERAIPNSSWGSSPNGCPLSFWCEVYGCGKEEAAENSPSIPPFRKFLELEGPILNFSDGLWAFHTLKEDPSYLRKPESLPAGGNQLATGRSSYPTHGTATTARIGPEILFQRHVLDSEKDYLYYAADMAERLAMHIPSHLRNLIEARAPLRRRLRRP